MTDYSPINQPSLTTHKWWAMLGIGLGTLMATIDASIVNISLPTLAGIFHTNFATIQWVVLSYALMLTSLMLGIGRLGDLLGKKKLYNIGLVIFTVGSFLCGMSPSVEWLIGYRALQGLGAAMTAALGTAIITEVFPSSERGRALGISGSIVSVGIALGPPIGGLLIGLVGWRFIFLVNVPIGVIATFVVARVVPTLPPHKTGERFDYTGALIALATLICYALGMTFWQAQGLYSSATLALLAAGGIGVIIFFLVETRNKHPMVDLTMFRNVLFSLNLIMAFLVFVVLAGNFIAPFYLELVKGYPTEQVGLFMMVYPVCMGSIAPIAGGLSDRYGSRLISLVGLIFIIAGCYSISTLQVNTNMGGIVLRLIPFGLGMGIFQSPNNSAVMGTAPPERLGVASGLLALARTLGQTTGLPLMGALFTTTLLTTGHLATGADITNAPPAALVEGVSGTYQIAAVIILAATALAALALWIDNRAKRKVPMEISSPEPQGHI